LSKHSPSFCLLDGSLERAITCERGRGGDLAADSVEHDRIAARLTAAGRTSLPRNLNAGADSAHKKSGRCGVLPCRSPARLVPAAAANPEGEFNFAFVHHTRRFARDA
jgi:hypothetical protein